jgi:hypothetical protein
MKPETVKLSSLKVNRKIRVFDIQAETLNAIVAHIKKNGFDEATPIIIWKGRNVIVEGHTRYEAAMKCGLKEVPIFERDFQDEMGAISYAIHCQRDRRNWTDAEKKFPMGGDRRSEKARSIFGTQKFDSRDQTASLTGLSKDTISKCRAVAYYKSGERGRYRKRNAVLNGSKSINRSYEELRREKERALKFYEFVESKKKWTNEQEFEYYLQHLTKDFLKVAAIFNNKICPYDETIRWFGENHPKGREYVLDRIVKIPPVIVFFNHVLPPLREMGFKIECPPHYTGQLEQGYNINLELLTMPDDLPRIKKPSPKHPQNPIKP